MKSKINFSLKTLKEMTKEELIKEYYEITSYLVESGNELNDQQYKWLEMKSNSIERRLIRHHNYFIGME